MGSWIWKYVQGFGKCQGYDISNGQRSRWCDGAEGVCQLGNLCSTPALFQASWVITEESLPLLGSDFMVQPVKSWPRRILHSLQAQTLYNSVAQCWRDLTMCKESRWQLRKVKNLKPKFDRTVPLPAHKSISLWGTVIGQNWSNLIGVLEPVKLLVSKCSVNSLVLEEG